jgi:hypothetical protein
VGGKPKRPELVTDIVIIDITGTNHYAGAE